MTEPTEPTGPAEVPMPPVEPGEVLRRDLGAIAAAVSPTNGLDRLARRLGRPPTTGPSAALADAATHHGPTEADDLTDDVADGNTGGRAVPGTDPGSPAAAPPLDLGEVSPTGRARRRPAPLVAAAAVVAALVVGAGLALRSTGDGPATTASTGPEATGWFAPVAAEPLTWSLEATELIPLSSEPVVVVRLSFTDADGVPLGLTLQPAGTATPLDLVAEEEAPPADTYLPMRLGRPTVQADGFDRDGRFVGLACVQAGGTWHDMDVRVVAGCSGDDDHPDADPLASLRSFVEALRPVDAEWRALVGPVVSADSPLLAPTYREAVDRFLRDATAATTPTTPTTVAGSTTTTDPGDAGPVDPEAHLTGAQYDDLQGLTFSLRPEATTVAAGRPLPLTLVVTNTTGEPRELTECTTLLTATGLVPADDPGAAVPQILVIDCYRSTQAVVPAGATVAFPLVGDQLQPWARTPRRGLYANPGGALAPGRYLLTAVVPGRHEPVRVQVPVTVTEPACPGFTDELVERLVDLPEADARAALGADRQLRVVSRAGVDQPITDDLRCDRVNVAVDVEGHVLDVDGVY